MQKQIVLLPLFEAIVNSIQAIDDMMPLSEGKIAITIHRDTGKLEFHHKEPDKQQEAFPIVGFSIHDNGIGFNDKNFNSFITA